MQNGLFEQGTAAKGHFGSSAQAAADGQTGWGATNFGSSVSQEFNMAEEDQPISRISQIAGSSVGSFGAGRSLGARIAKGLLLAMVLVAVIFFGNKMLLEGRSFSEAVDDAASIFGLNHSGLLTTDEGILPKAENPSWAPPAQPVVHSEVLINTSIKPADSQTFFQNPYSSIPHEGFFRETVSTQPLSSEQENSFRERLESPVYYQRYSVPQDIMALKRGGTEELLRTALANGKFWMRMHSVIGLADSGYMVSGADVETALGSSHSELRARFFERFTGSRPCLDGCLFVVRESLKFLDARGRISALNVIFQVDSPTHRDFAVAATFDQDPTVRRMAKEFLLKYPIDEERWQALYLAMAQAEPIESTINTNNVRSKNIDPGIDVTSESTDPAEQGQPPVAESSSPSAEKAVFKSPSGAQTESLTVAKKSDGKKNPPAQASLSAKMIPSTAVPSNPSPSGVVTEQNLQQKPDQSSQRPKKTNMSAKNPAQANPSMAMTASDQQAALAVGSYLFVGILLAWLMLQMFLIPVFVKAGEPWWAALVPIYSVICMARIAELPAIFGLLFQVPFFWPVLYFFMLKSFKLDNLQALVSLILHPFGMLYVGLSPSVRHNSRTRYELEMMMSKSPGGGGPRPPVPHVPYATGFEKQNVHTGVHLSPSSRASDAPTNPFQMPMSQAQSSIQGHPQKVSINLDTPSIPSSEGVGQTRLSDSPLSKGHQVSPASALQDAALDSQKDGGAKESNEPEPLLVKKTVTFAL